MDSVEALGWVAIYRRRKSQKRGSSGETFNMRMRKEGKKNPQSRLGASSNQSMPFTPSSRSWRNSEDDGIGSALGDG